MHAFSIDFFGAENTRNPHANERFKKLNLSQLSRSFLSHLNHLLACGNRIFLTLVKAEEKTKTKCRKKRSNMHVFSISLFAAKNARNPHASERFKQLNLRHLSRHFLNHLNRLLACGNLIFLTLVKPR